MVDKPLFESGASTNSATGARSGAARIKPMGGTGSTLARALFVRFYAPAHASLHPRPEAPRQARLHHGRQRRDGDLPPARPAIQPHRATIPLARPQGRRPRRAVPGEQRPVLRDLLGRPALGPDLHRHQLAADRRPRSTTSSATAAPSSSSRPSISPTRPRELAPLLKGVAASLHDRRHDRRATSPGRKRSRASPRRRSPTRPPATTCSIRRAPPAGPRACCRCVEPQAIDYDNPLLAITRKLYGMDADTVYLSPAPLYHAAPLRFNMSVMRLGGTSVIMEHFDAEEFLKLVEQAQDHAHPARADHVRALPQAARRGAR